MYALLRQSTQQRLKYFLSGFLLFYRTIEQVWFDILTQLSPLLQPAFLCKTSRVKFSENFQTCMPPACLCQKSRDFHKQLMLFLFNEVNQNFLQTLRDVFFVMFFRKNPLCPVAEDLIFYRITDITRKHKQFRFFSYPLRRTGKKQHCHHYPYVSAKFTSQYPIT